MLFLGWLLKGDLCVCAGTANDVESHAEIKGFPTILFYKSNDKKNPSTWHWWGEVFVDLR